MLLKKLRIKLEANSTAWKSHQVTLEPFLVTTGTEPRLAWLPKTHNATTQGLLDKRPAEVEICDVRGVLCRWCNS